jgi:hypothetical protein
LGLGLKFNKKKDSIKLSVDLLGCKLSVDGSDTFLGAEYHF